MANISESASSIRRSRDSPPPPLSPASSMGYVRFEPPLPMLPSEQLLTYGHSTNSFRDILNTAVQTDRQVQPPPEILGKW